MKAFAISGYGQPLEVVEVPEPSVGDHDVLIAMEAAGVNHLDAKIAEGEFKALLPYAFPLTLGHDVAGVVLGIGSQVTGFDKGDRVFGRLRDGRIGAFAERVAVDSRDLAHIPAPLSFEEAASLPLVALTAWQALVELGNVQPGEKVLIHAGAGGVGTVAIQLAKHLGATVATTVSAKHAERVRELGADIVVDYRSQDFSELLRGYDLVLDSVGGDNLEKSLQILKRGGRAIGIAGPPTPEFARATGANLIVRAVIAMLSRRIRRAARRLGVRYDFLWMRADGQQLAALGKLVEAGNVLPVVGEVFSFAEAPAALAALGAGTRPGKIVIKRSH